MNSKDEILVTSEVHHWTSEEKLKHCGYGEWVEEADVTEFQYLGYVACIFRAFKKEPFSKEEAYFGGHLCGYVQIPSDHPLFGNNDLDIGLDCHGGITFNHVHEEHWIGFDCAHLHDYIPTMEMMKKKLRDPGKFEVFTIPEGFENNSIYYPIYKNVDYCINECKTIIRSLIDFSNSKKTAAEKEEK